MKIVIIKTGAMGDVLRTTSILPGLKLKYEDPSITWIVAKNAYDIIKTNHLISRILIFEDINNIDGCFDLVINLEESEKACEIASRIDKKRLFGAYLENGKIIYSDDSKDWFDLSLISQFGKRKADELKKANKQSYQEIISNALGTRVSRPILNLTKKEEAFAEQFKIDNAITDMDFIIGIATGAGARWRYKSLNIRKTIQLIEEIKKEFSVKIIIFDKDEKRNREIAQHTNAINACTNNSPMEFAGLVNLCDILITSDSLALHIATALNKKVVVFFGPTSFAEIELYGRGIKIILKIDCLGCYKNDCDFNPNCTDLLEINDFIEAIRKLK